MASSAITGTTRLAASPTGYAGEVGNANVQLSPAVQELWSKEILFQSMPILRFEQFAVKKTELGVQPGLTIHFMRYDNLGTASQLIEAKRLVTHAINANQFDISVYEHGYAIAVSELLLHASFDDVMASASRLLGRNMATYLDTSCRDTLMLADSVLFGYDKTGSTTITNRSPYDVGTPAADYSGLNGSHYFTTAVVKDAVETLAMKNVPRLGETYVCFVDPRQSRRLRDDPEYLEVTKYAGPGNFMLGEIGRYQDVVFIETTQVDRRKYDTVNNAFDNEPGYVAGNDTEVARAVFIGDNAFGHAISLPVELRDGGVLDFGREHALAWYAIWGLGLIQDRAVVIAATN